MSRPQFEVITEPFDCQADGCRGESSEAIRTTDYTGDRAYTVIICRGCLQYAGYALADFDAQRIEKANAAAASTRKIEKLIKPCKRCGIPSKRNRQALCRRCAICVKAEKRQ